MPNLAGSKVTDSFAKSNLVSDENPFRPSSSTRPNEMGVEAYVAPVPPNQNCVDTD
jgi:hypothetical protein